VALLFGAMLASSALTSPAAAQSASDLVKQAVAAQGGAEALKSLKTISIKGEAKFWEPGQAFKPGGEPRFLGDATYTAAGDFTTHTVRIDWDRDQKYPDPPVKMKYSETMTQKMGYVTAEKDVSANAPMLASATTVPDSVKNAKGPAADAPYQWVMRRIFLARFLDSDEVIYPAGGSLKLVELAPNVQHVQGGSANNLIVA